MIDRSGGKGVKVWAWNFLGHCYWTEHKENAGRDARGNRVADANAARAAARKKLGKIDFIICGPPSD
jgi:hypothetical protein